MEGEVLPVGSKEGQYVEGDGPRDSRRQIALSAEAGY